MWDDWNFQVKVLGKGIKRLRAGVSLFFDKDSSNHRDHVDPNPTKEEFTHWGKFNKNGVSYLCLSRKSNINEAILWQYNQPNEIKIQLTPLPFKLDEEAAVKFLWGWLKSLEEAEWGREPDCDGTVKRECFCLETVTANSNVTMLLIHPVWAEYHK